MRATKPLEIVLLDVCGPMRTTSLGGARYFVTYIDDFSRKVWDEKRGKLDAKGTKCLFLLEILFVSISQC